MTRLPIALELAACFILLAALGCNASSEQDGPALSVTFEIDQSDIARVEWMVSGGGLAAPISGLAEVTGGATPTVAVTIMDLPVATGYGIVLTAYDAADTNICRGSASFDITESTTTNVPVELTCSISSTLPYGTVGIDATFQDNICPVINQINVVPQTIAVGQTATVSVNATDPEGGTLGYDWTSLAGTFADPTAASTTYTCTQALDHNINVMVDDGDPFCVQSRLLNVTCVADACAGPPAVTCDDGDQCTDDGVCDPVSGCPGSTLSSTDTRCDLGGTLDGYCNGAGACVECNADGDCTDDGNECTAATPTCNASVCEQLPLADGTPCSAGVCSLGACVGCITAGDCADDGNECTASACNANVCEDNPLTGTACTVGGVICDAGACVECIDVGQCTADDGNECTANACTGNACVNDPLNGTACSSGGTVCSAGSCVQCITAGDCTDDGNQCTAASPTCNVSGLCEQPALAAGSPCTQVTTDDSVCDGAGACVECTDATHCDDGDQCTATPCNANVCDPPIIQNGLPCDAGTGPGSGTCDATGACI